MPDKTHDNPDFYAAASLAEQIAGSIAGRQPVPESIERLLADNPHLAEMCRRNGDESYIAERLGKYYSGDRKRQINRLKNGIRRRSANRRIIRIFTNSVSVAALLLFALFIRMDMPDRDTSASSVQIFPRVILADGRDVILTPETAEADPRFELSEYGLKIKNTEPQTGDILNTLLIPAGMRYEVELGDGSTVTLNAGSVLRYPSAFTSDSREVILEGEGFFRIAESAVPFRVVTDCCTITAYGTGFNVKTAARGYVETILVEGSIGVMCGGADERMMTPGQKANVSSGGIEILASADMKTGLAWLNNDFDYDQACLVAALGDIENWYGISIERKENISQDETINLCVSRDLPFADLLSIIERSCGYTFRVKEGGAVIGKN